MAHDFSYHVAMPPNSVLEKIASSIDPETPSFRSLTGYAGTKEFVGRIRDEHFVIRKKRRYLNGFAPDLHGRIIPEEKGSFVRLTFRLRLATKIIVVLWSCALVVLLGLFLSD